MSLPPIDQEKPVKRRRSLAWLALLLLLGSIYFFWVLPIQRGTKPVRVDFVNSNK